MGNVARPCTAEPEIRSREGFVVAGLARGYDMETRVAIPQLWQAFVPHIGSIPGRIGAGTYGLCIPTQPPGDSFTYVAGVEVAAADGLEAPLQGFAVPAAEYLVFTHEGPLDTLQQTMAYIFGTYLPESDFEPAGTADFERYDDRFDPETGLGGLEIWVPVLAPG